MEETDEIPVDWSTAIGDLKSSEAFTQFFLRNREHMIEVDGDSPADKKWKTALLHMFHGTAKARGFKWHKETRQYVVVPKEITPMSYGRPIGY